MTSMTTLAATGCSFWTTQLSFTTPIDARQFCLLGNNRYAAPTTLGTCNDHDPTTDSVCEECLTLDGQQKRPCSFVKGHPTELGIAPQPSGYDDVFCPMGFEEHINTDFLDLACPSDSVLVLEILNGTESFDFEVYTEYHDIERVFEAHRCLTGKGGRDCDGEDTLTMYAYERDGICRLDFHSGQGYKVQCDNGLVGGSSPSFHGGSRQQTCFSRNALTCLEVMQYSAAASKTNVVVLNADDDDAISNSLCGLDEGETLSDPLAWLVGVLAVLFTLFPSVLCWRKGSMSMGFLMGLLAEAAKNGLIMTSLVTVNWSCLQKHGLVLPTGNHAIFLPYSMIVFSLADNILALIAILFREGRGLDETYDQFKWSADENNLARRVMTFATIVIFGGLGGFMQLALVLEGVVDNPEESGGNALSSWASWVFIISASLGGLVGGILIIFGAVYPSKMRLAWKTYKILVGNIPGLVAAFDLAVVLSGGWSGEMLADFVHLVLYLPPLLQNRKRAVEEPTE